MKHCWLRYRCHHWRNKAAEQFDMRQWFAGEMRVVGTKTRVLKVCMDCNREKVKVLDGSWELEDLT